MPFFYFRTCHNGFAVLLAEKRIQERRNIPLAEISEMTGISRRAVYAWENNGVHRFDEEVIDALCQYFNIRSGECLNISPTKSPNKKAPAPQVGRFYFITS
jgi:transcriptional regulator with XRE-family HTH domain